MYKHYLKSFMEIITQYYELRAIIILHLRKVSQSLSRMSKATYCHSVTHLCHQFVIPWTVAHQTPLSVGFPR